MKKFLYKKMVWFAASGLLVFISIQFIREPLENHPVGSFISAPDNIQRILVRSCFDCHSDITRLSWYDKIAPASWVVQDHVREGRRVLNFTEWDSLTEDQHKAAVFESFNQMQFGIMPLSQYAFVHRAAKIRAEDLAAFRAYLGTLVTAIRPDSIKLKMRDEQYVLWVNGVRDGQMVRPSLNGIQFNPDYKNWRAISSTERFDNGTMRVIVANDLAVRAVEGAQMNPWPDGSVIAKILWISVMDSTGLMQAGAFRQVDFMVKDRKKYASTEGWGFARWTNGLQMNPYGKDPAFASECLNCHRSMKAFDFVFTKPINPRIPSGLGNKVITSFVDKNRGTMSILYANKIASQFSRTHTARSYPEGSVLTLVTWMQKEDEHWFGARIPDQIQSVETVKVGKTGVGSQTTGYEKYSGSLPGNVNKEKSPDEMLRTDYILSQRASVIP